MKHDTKLLLLAYVVALAVVALDMLVWRPG